MLKYTTERVVDSFDWDKLVRETYGRDYCLQQQDGCKSRGNEYFTVPSTELYDYEQDEIPIEVNGDVMGVSLKAWKERNPEEKFFPEENHSENLFWERNFYPNLDVLAQDMYEKGLIEAGEYTINIDW